MEMQLKNRVALVTGGTRDVGREIALTLAAEGATVAVHHRSSPDEAEAVVADIRKQGGKAKAYQADVADRAAVQSMIQSIVADHGGLNILVNNAGLAIRKPFKDTTPEEWRSQIDVNLMGAIHLCHAAAPHLEKGGHGRIIAIVGDLSRVGESGLSIVAAARAGVIGLMKSIARELGRSGRDREHGFARHGRDRARSQMARSQPREAHPISIRRGVSARRRTSRRRWRCSPRRAAAGSPAR